MGANNMPFNCHVSIEKPLQMYLASKVSKNQIVDLETRKPDM